MRAGRDMLNLLLCDPVFASALDTLPESERWKRFPPFAGSRHALKKVLHYEKTIRLICSRECVSSCAVMAVLFRETLGYGFDDLLDRMHASSSRGLCQIRAETARRADAYLGKEEKTPAMYRKLLMKPEENLRCCARILRHEALQASADPLNPDDQALLKMFRAYNGSMTYAVQTLQYCRAFERMLP